MRAAAPFAAAAIVLAALISAAPPGGALAASSSALSDEPIPLITEAEIARRRGEPAPRAGDPHDSTLSEKPTPLLTEEQEPKPTPPIFERGDKFLASGNITPGITLPTGAIWQPALWVFGDFRTTAGHFDNGAAESRQFQANRLDLFLNLKLTPTERVLLGISPLSDGNDHTGILHRSSTGTRFVNGLNPYITTLFFEGEFGEIFPNLDPDDTKSLDFGFAIGRQPLLFQEGIMINDTVDALGITRDTIVIPGLTPDMRATALVGWSNVHRDNNLRDRDAWLFGLFTETDLRKSTVNLDAAYVLSTNPNGGDGLYLGAAATQRIGLYNTSFRVNTSTAVNGRGPSPNNAVDDGVLLFSEVSRTETGSENIYYANAFWGIGNYSSAARDPTAGGPLGRTGILFAAPAVGLGGAALSNRADHVVGGALGYQMFFNHEKTQLTLELGGRKDTDGSNQGAVALGGQLLHALDNRSSVQLDAFISEGQNRTFGSGLRVELRTRF
ncbi:hypothetical protein [Breoghania sp. L-A4]|uniref:hypothetical protein n=1 Tax=Breoghania sp. L-A4 TaxID=2304600 RepID=UPI000E35B613|nr:hypothetical protein [Breoghania sp. L-A4]AXS41664.1 hypothetical protein D1F64_18745 [Breoghania sp. L-A4]